MGSNVTWRKSTGSICANTPYRIKSTLLAIATDRNPEIVDMQKLATTANDTEKSRKSLECMQRVPGA